MLTFFGGMNNAVTYRLQTVLSTLSIYKLLRGDVQSCQHRLQY